MQVLLPPGWAAPIGHASGISAAPGRIAFVAGQVGCNEQRQFESPHVVPQFEQALKNVLAMLAQAGGDARHICRMTAVVPVA
jgi:enamine deaminase RidA (YjgF/YER057c/UK114 family)